MMLNNWIYFFFNFIIFQFSESWTLLLSAQVMINGAPTYCHEYINSRHARGHVHKHHPTGVNIWPFNPENIYLDAEETAPRRSQSGAVHDNP